MKSVAIVLNGASSSGKTSIARSLQRLSTTPFLHASLDVFTDMFHWPAITDQTVRKECHHVGVANFHAALPLLASSRFPLVVDHIFEQHSWFEACRDALKETQTFFVGVHCPLPVLESREIARGDRRGGLAKWQFDRVHQNMSYALEFDTSVVSSDDCATSILRFMQQQTEANQALQHNDPGCHVSCLRTPRASRGRG
jgi:chloramphenicol 3-O-phosphotransferase